VAAVAAAKLDQLKEAQRRIRALEEELAGEAARALAGEGGRVATAHWADKDAAFLQRVGREFARLAPERIALFTAGPGDEGFFVLCAGERATLDLAAAGRRVAAILSGRGGGAGRLFQGKAAALSRRAEAATHLQSL
jgi:misacylated tRNA(Ala) deacylase